MWFMRDKNVEMVDPAEALAGRNSRPFKVPEQHSVLGNRLEPPYPQGLQRAVFGMGCFWGAERIFWKRSGVWTTAVGYAGGYTPHPTYEEVCSGRTGHTEAVLVLFDPAAVAYDALLSLFWENHDPTQGMRQGNDVGTQYRSAIYVEDDTQRETALKSRALYAEALEKRGMGPITTEIADGQTFWFAEGYHQQYLAKNPHGYCGIGGTGVSYPRQLTRAA